MPTREGRNRFGLYLRRQASSPSRYFLEQLIQWIFGGIPRVVGIALRSAEYRAILRMHGLVAVERNVRVCFADNVRLARRKRVDQSR